MNYTVKIVDGEPQRIFRKTVHQFMVSDCEDPEVFAAQPIWEWQQTEKGKWVMEHAISSPMFMHHLDNSSYAYKFAIVADLYERDATYYALKWE